MAQPGFPGEPGRTPEGDVSCTKASGAVSIRGASSQVTEKPVTPQRNARLQVPEPQDGGAALSLAFCSPVINTICRERPRGEPRHLKTLSHVFEDVF